MSRHVPYVDLWAEDGRCTMQLIIENPPITSSGGLQADTPAAYMDMNAETLPEMYRNFGIEVTETSRTQTTLAGRDYEVFSFTAESAVSMTQTMLCTEKDGLFFTIYITCTGEDRTEEILSLFTADP